ncbi:MAG: DUF4835 family protein [Candidatus Marinimicrobia bacterium]|nr:DUF4835 family protein [Candidatus Neomarinimicrobiota bacterium]MCF7840196.1 DUF4835 family protein [Candidatus Neomarinimicrobiota bacterium]
MQPKRIILTILALLWFSPAVLTAQVISADITIDATRLDDTQQQAAKTLQRTIQYYIESTNWLIDAYETPFKIQAQIFIDTYTEDGSLQLWTGKAFWGNGADQKYYDKLVQFGYRRGDQLIHSSRFEPLAGFIDYWVNILLAGELDTYKQFGGAQHYAAARRIAEQGAQSSLKKGWEDRLTTVEDLSNNQNFRKLKFAYYEAIYRWNNHEDKEAFRQIEIFLDNLEAGLQKEKARIYIKQFMDAKYRDFSDFLWEVGKRNYLAQLARVDDDHTKYYQELLDAW